MAAEGRLFCESFYDVNFLARAFSQTHIFNRSNDRAFLLVSIKFGNALQAMILTVRNSKSKGRSLENVGHRFFVLCSVSIEINLDLLNCANSRKACYLVNRMETASPGQSIIPDRWTRHSGITLPHPNEMHSFQFWRHI